MNAKRYSVVLVLVLALALAGPGVNPAGAEGEMPEKGESCVQCHADLYMLYDTGKYHCLCQAKASCTDCHGGVVNTLDEAIAHQNMIANPLGEGGEVCQRCHPQDFEARVEQFMLIAGAHPATTPVPTFECSQEAVAPTMLDDLLRPRPIEPWRLASLGLVLIAFFGLLVVAVRCCVEDRYYTTMKGSSQR